MHTTLKTTKRLPFRYYKSNHHSFITIFKKHTIYCVYIYRFYTISCIKYTPLCYATKNNTNSNIEFVFFLRHKGFERAESHTILWIVCPPRRDSADQLLPCEKIVDTYGVRVFCIGQAERIPSLTTMSAFHAPPDCQGWRSLCKCTCSLCYFTIPYAINYLEWKNNSFK